MAVGEKPSNLPLNSDDPIAALTKAGEKVTPQMALLQTMAVMHQKAQQLTGVAVPKYYNPAAVNPLKYAEQVQKRKLLWGKKDKEKEQTEEAPAVPDAASGLAASAAMATGSAAKCDPWSVTSFAQDSDGKMAAKFRKLMGIREGEKADANDEKTKEYQQKQDELFRQLDNQYEFARITTHTQRGVGLGFSMQGIPPASK